MRNWEFHIEPSQTWEPFSLFDRKHSYKAERAAESLADCPTARFIGIWNSRLIGLPQGQINQLCEEEHLTELGA